MNTTTNTNQLNNSDQLQEIAGGFKIRKKLLQNEYYFETQFDVFGPYSGTIFNSEKEIHYF